MLKLLLPVSELVLRAELGLVLALLLAVGPELELALRVVPALELLPKLELALLLEPEPPTLALPEE